MHLNISRENLLQPLQMVLGVVEKRQTFPILSHVLFTGEEQFLTITGTDLEVELVSRIELGDNLKNFRAALPVRKLVDICRSLPEQSLINIDCSGDRVVLKSGRSKYILTALPADDFPKIEDEIWQVEFPIEEQNLKNILEKTTFAIAEQDVRFFLNGLVWDVKGGNITAVATDGHRMAVSEQAINVDPSMNVRCIVPRKGIIELQRLLNAVSSSALVKLGEQQICIQTDKFTFRSKLIRNNFPDYRIPLQKSREDVFIANKKELKQVLNRAAVLTAGSLLSGVRLEITSNSLIVLVTNQENDEAEEELEIQYTGNNTALAFNVNYLLDVLSVLEGDEAKFTFSNSERGVLIESRKDEKKCLYGDALEVIVIII